MAGHFFVCVYMCACALMRERLFKAAHLLSVMNPKGLTTVHTTEETHAHTQIKSPAPSTCSSYLFSASFVKYCVVTHMTSVSCLFNVNP